MSDLIGKLMVSLTASCTCLCKTPEVSAHDEMCRYMLTREAIDEINRLRNGLVEILGDDPVEDTWEEVISPHIDRFVIASEFGADVVHNSIGAKAMGSLISDMARRLDSAIIRIRTLLNK